jgi:hypothetical protein
MTDATEISEVIKQYAKHGWVLRRVLLSDASLKDAAIDSPALFGDAPVTAEEFDGLWFSRVSEAGSEAWELRRLGGSPYALVAVIGDADGDDEREATLAALVRKIRSTAVRGN